MTGREDAPCGVTAQKLLGREERRIALARTRGRMALGRRMSLADSSAGFDSLVRGKEVKSVHDENCAKAEHLGSEIMLAGKRSGLQTRKGARK